MGVIKTALEIALEKTESVKSDKSSIDQYEIAQKGKKLANGFISGDVNLQAELKNVSKDKKETLKQGIFDVLITQITLPDGNDGQTRLEKVCMGLSEIIGKNEFNGIYMQFLQLTGQYLQEAAQYEQAIRQQYAPKLKQKETELSRRLGREVRIDPLQDPEFVAFYNQHITALRGNYESVVEQVKAEARRLFE